MFLARWSLDGFSLVRDVCGRPCMHRARSENHSRHEDKSGLTCCASDIMGHRTGLKATRAWLRVSSSFGRR